MNIQQLKYVLEIAKQGSFSKAAQRLFISQPSLSNAIKELEQEIGMTIFLRNQNGIKITPIGIELCNKVRTILEQIDDIYTLSSTKQSYTFKLATENYSFAMAAFNEFCKEYQHFDKINFAIQNYEMMEVIESVANLESDLGILLINSSSFNACVSILIAKNLEYVKLAELPVNINLRSKHPLLKDPDFKFEQLNQYPFVRYANEKKHVLSYMPNLSTLGIINPEKSIYVTDRELKCNIVSQTDAFSIGSTLHPDYIAKFDIIARPIPDNYVSVCYIKTNNSILSKEALRFIELLKNNLLK